MLSMAHQDKFHMCGRHRRCCRRKVDGAKFRRRNRARDTEDVRQLVEVESDPAYRLPEPFQLYWTDDEAAPSDEVWRWCCENYEGLRFVDFDGTYTLGG